MIEEGIEVAEGKWSTDLRNDDDAENNLHLGLRESRESSPRPSSEAKGRTLPPKDVELCASVDILFAGIPDYELWRLRFLPSERAPKPKPFPTKENSDAPEDKKSQQDSFSSPRTPLSQLNTKPSNCGLSRSCRRGEDNEDTDSVDERTSLNKLNAGPSNSVLCRRRRRDEDDEDDDYVDEDYASDATHARRKKQKTQKTQKMQKTQKTQKTRKDPNRPQPRQGEAKSRVKCPNEQCTVEFPGKQCGSNVVTKHYRESHGLEAHCAAYKDKQVPCPLGGCSQKKPIRYRPDVNNMYKDIARHIYMQHMDHPLWHCLGCDLGFDRKDAAQRHMDDSTQCPARHGYDENAQA